MKLSVLLIEDDEGYQFIIQEYIQRDADVYPVDSLKKAIEVIEAGASFDVCLLDLGLPDTPTYSSTIDKFFAINPRMAVVVISNHDILNMMKYAFEYGAEGYLVKGKLSEEWLKETIFRAYYNRSVKQRQLSQQIDDIDAVMRLWTNLMIEIEKMRLGLQGAGLEENLVYLDDVVKTINRTFDEIKDRIYPKPTRGQIEKLASSLKADD